MSVQIRQGIFGIFWDSGNLFIIRNPAENPAIAIRGVVSVLNHGEQARCDLALNLSSGLPWVCLDDRDKSQFQPPR